jgi:nitrogen-specific signal transduction histidine kinase
MSESQLLICFRALESLADAIVIIDAEQIVQFVNTAAKRLLRIEAKSTVGITLTDFMAKSQIFIPQLLIPEKFAKLYESIGLSVPDPHEQRLSGTTADGRQIEFRTTSIWIDERQQRIGLIIQIRETTLEFTASNLLNSLFNEIMSPLNAIAGYADLLLSGAAGPMPEEQREMVTVIRANATRLSRMKNDLMAMRRKQYQTQKDNTE